MFSLSKDFQHKGEILANQKTWKEAFFPSALPLGISTVVHTTLILLLALCVQSENAPQKLSLAAAFANDDGDSDALIATVRMEARLQPIDEEGELGVPTGPAFNMPPLNDSSSDALAMKAIFASLKTGKESLDRVGAPTKPAPNLQVHSVYVSAKSTLSETTSIRFGNKRLPGARHAGFANSQPLEVIVPDLDRYGSSVLNQASNLSLTGGAMMVSTAKPHPALANVPLRLEYDATNVDGNRLIVVAGEYRSILSLYDWELQPLARFVDAGHHGAVHIQMFGKHEKISLDAAFEHTLLGLRFIQADLLPRGVILSQDYLPQDSRGVLLGPGEQLRLSSEQEVREAVGELEPLMAKTRNGAPYSVLTDAKVQFEFEIVGNELVISGSPYFFFWEPANKGDQVIPKKTLNDLLKKAWPTIKKANPLVIESMERSFRTVAFFRFQKQKSPSNWARFVQQLNGLTLEKIPTPSLLSGE